jgi:hypothetical protein
VTSLAFLPRHEKRRIVRPCGHRIALVQIAVAAPSLVRARLRRSVIFLETSLTHLQNRSACVIITLHEMIVPMKCRNGHTGIPK